MIPPAHENLDKDPRMFFMGHMNAWLSFMAKDQRTAEILPSAWGSGHLSSPFMERSL